MFNPSCPLSVEEHLRQLQRVYGPIGPAFAAEELGCSLNEAAEHLYGTRAEQHTWVSLPDMVCLCGANKTELKRWVQQEQIECRRRTGQGKGTPMMIRLVDAQRYLEAHPAGAAHPFGTVHALFEYLPRFTAGERPNATPASEPKAKSVDVDWALARQAAWPMTAERLADAVYGTRSAGEQHKARRLLQRWETQGRVTCFARGLYDLVRPALLLSAERYGRRALPQGDLQKLRAHHPEIAHWPNGSLAAAWRAYSRVFGSGVLPVFERREPSWLEYLLIRQLHPDVQVLRVDAAYEALCREVALYRLLPAPVPRPAPTKPIEVTVENIEAGLVDFKALAEATRRKLQRNFGAATSAGSSHAGPAQRLVTRPR
ncbi:hypothetical protein [Deinococcus hopiensis]|uniref:Uncharacterized protein n=1 Tax=Deinococcus hopiensis KR-140 TaxID=695939 RepID=A0A1W1VV08_9DEIO|nr:hypothetical protein [Deinococcus hopiensis]SMB97103.1 hypothetical protein SAMN00790413_06343 [Deinococcus hopiensis KR-140]